MGMTVWLGVDIGTSAVKALAIDEAGREVATGSRPTRWRQVASGSETTPDVFLDAVLGATAEALAVAGERTGTEVRAAGIGLTGLAESGVLLEPDGTCHMPVVAWFDQRGLREISELDAAVVDEFVVRTGLYVDAQATFAKLLWWRGAGGHVRPGACWLSVPEWIGHVLGGERVSEPSLASRTGLFDIDAEVPWASLLQAHGLPTNLFPPSVRAGTAIGAVSADTSIAALAGAPITVVGHDHPVAAIGVGCVHAEDLFNSTGTSDVLIRSVGAVDEARRRRLAAAGVAVGCHPLAGRYALNAGVRAGLTLQRVLDLLGLRDRASALALDAVAAELTELPSGLRLTGVSNLVDEVVITMRDGTSPAALWRVGAQAAAAETAKLLAVIEEVVGPHNRAVAAGGWSNYRSVRAAKRQVIPGLEFHPTSQAGALGAALVAQYASDPGGTVEDFIAARTRVSAPENPLKEDM